MIYRALMTGTAFGLLAACATAQDVETPGWLAKDFAELTDMFEGRWDNDRHVFFAADAGMDVTRLAPRQHVEIKRVTLAGDAAPTPGTVTFEATRTVEGEAAVDLVHAFTIDSAAQIIRQTMAAPGGLLPPAGFDCHVDWARDGAQFRGTADGAQCDEVFPRPVEGGPLETVLTLSDTEFWVRSRRGAEQIEARLRRARPFECWTAILRGAEHGDSGQGQNDWDFRRGVKLHDQGGVAELVTDEETPRLIRLKLRDVDWPYGTNRASLTMYVHEGDSDRAVSYTWTEAGAERIGINLRWLQASCTYTPETGDED